MLKPLHDRVVLRRLDSEEKTPGGIVIPDNAKEKPQRGRVVAVGDGRRDDHGVRIPVDVREGDVVLFAKYSGSEVKLGGIDHLIVVESEILAIVERAS